MSDIHIHMEHRPHWASRELWLQLTYCRCALAALKEAMLAEEESIRKTDKGSAIRKVHLAYHEDLRGRSQGLKQAHRELVAYGPKPAFGRRAASWERRGAPGLHRVPLPGRSRTLTDGP